jgi:hypothetical protein
MNRFIDTKLTNVQRCGHCKALEPVLDSLSRHFSEDSRLQIGRFDITKNDVHYPGVRVLGYPTIYAFSKRGRNHEGVCSSTDTNSGSCEQHDVAGEFEISIVEYDGARTVKDIKKFISSL